MNVKYLKTLKGGRTTPSSGQATTNSELRHHRLPACHSGAALEGSVERQQCWRLDVKSSIWAENASHSSFGCDADSHIIRRVDTH